MIARGIVPALCAVAMLAAFAGAARAEITPLHKAAWAGDLAVVEKLIAAGADPNARGGEYGFTPLRVAADNNENPALVKALIAGGADPNARDKAGLLPFDYARGNKALKGTDVYWRLNEARFE